MPPVLPLALLTCVVLVVAATALLFTVRPSRRTAGNRPGRGPSAAAGAGAAALVVAWALGGSAYGVAAVGALVTTAVLAWARVARPWAVRGLWTWALTVLTVVLYLVYVLVWTLTADLTLLARGASLALWTVELFVALLGVGYVWELVDVLARRRWREAGAAPATARRPFVSLHVPTHNEPPEMVIETLEHLLRLDYEDYEVLLVDNNTTDPALWRPVEQFCDQHDRITFIHLENWPGYKSGALNHALTRTDPRAEVIGIVDADYHVQSDFLTACAPHFAEDDVAFVQTPQDYRDWEESAYFRRLYHSYAYFFEVSQRSRSERNGAIFGGTMGLIRRSALEDVGGWDEWCITEDAELSLRLLRAGDRGVHIGRSYGRGVMPLTFEALKGQRFRWCFGGVQILRLHWRSLLPGRRSASNQLTGAQRWAYLVGGLQWFGDLAGLAFTAFLTLGTLDALFGGGLVVRRLSGLLLLAVVALVALGALRSIALVRRTSDASWREAVGAFGLWLALGLTVARAAWLGLVSREGAFLRTPKVRGEPNARDALRGNRPETVLAVFCLLLGGGAIAAGAVHGTWSTLTVASLLLIQGVGYAAAPLNSLAAIRADLPPGLGQQRREWARSWTTVSRPAQRGAVLAATGVAAAVLLVLAASPLQSPPLGEIPIQAVPSPPPAPATEDLDDAPRRTAE
ncbi:MAG: glycosyltransferase, partial [Nocardioides sp.]|nr:glycosyltransferase [Nocardioides sp.]